MQQHSGQHLLSQSFYHLFKFETVSVRIGADETTLDLDTATLTPSQIDEAEQQANQLIYENRPIIVYYLNDDELDHIPLRGKPAVTGRIRIVEIDKFDYSACGGTHCRSTVEFGPLKVLGHERMRGIVRLSFKCGQRALADYGLKHQLVTTLTGQLNVKDIELPEAVTRQQEQLKELQKQYDLLAKMNLGFEARELFNQAEDVAGVRIITRSFPDRAVTDLKTLAVLLQENPRTVVFLGGVANEKLSLVYTRSSDLALNMADILGKALAKYDGRGGGKADFAQGGVHDPSQAEAILADSRRWVLDAIAE